jgi:3-deoxy-manno-octulosonate cytidylyltransferase (CMP-KDO synthetase)
MLCGVLDEIYVATDSDEIKRTVESYGGKAIMTSDKHTTGIERTEEATRFIDCDLVVLINGDEAMLNPQHIQCSLQTLLDSDAPTALLASYFDKEKSFSDFKIAINLKGEALYFSREDIPSPSRSGVRKFLKAYHIISFKKKFLSEYIKLPKTPFEIIEGHDHLRIIEHGFKVQIGIVDHTSVSVDTQEDLDFVCNQMKDDALFMKYMSDTKINQQK